MVDRRPVALDVVGRLMVEMGGESARIDAQGDLIVIELPSLRAGASIVGRWPGGAGRRLALRRIHEGLAGAGLKLEVRVGARTIGRLGAGSRAGLASRLLGYDPLEIRFGGVLGSLRRPSDRRE